MLYRPDHARVLVFPFVFIGFVIALVPARIRARDRRVSLRRPDGPRQGLSDARSAALHRSAIQHPVSAPDHGAGRHRPAGRRRLHQHAVSAPAHLWLAGVGGRAAGHRGRARGPDGRAQRHARRSEERADPVRGAGIPGAAAGDGADLQSHAVSRPRRLGHHRAVPAGAVRELGRRSAPIAPLVLVVALFFVPGLNRWFWQTVFDRLRA